MSALANRAGRAGADWIIPFDADEIWRARRGTLRDAMEGTTASILAAPIFDHIPRPTIRRGTPLTTMPWSRHNGWMKVAFRWRPGAIIAIGNHSVEGVDGEINHEELIIDHYPHRSWRQYRRKVHQGAAALALTDAPDHMAPHWRIGAAMPNWKLRLSWWQKRLELRARLRDPAAM
jgi:hypothetical protein